MKRAALPFAALLAVGAKPPNEAMQFLLLGGVAAAFLVALGLPVALLLHAHLRGFLDREARAVERRATACALIGSGLFVAAAFVVAVFASRSPPLAAFALAVCAAWFFVGFAGGARLHGERMLGVAPVAASPRALVLGWLARAGLCAVPLVWPLLAAYLVIVAFGAPLVALFEKHDGDAPVT